MTNYCCVLVKMLDDGECLKHLVGGKQLHIDYRPEATSVQKAEFAESGCSIETVIMNYQINTCHSVPCDGIMCARK
jgi:hypothetical protein